MHIDRSVSDWNELLEVMIMKQEGQLIEAMPATTKVCIFLIIGFFTWGGDYEGRRAGNRSYANQCKQMQSFNH